MMDRPSAKVYEEERNAIDTLPQHLRPHAGEERFQAALEADAVYRRLVLAATAIAFCAGTGFGRLPLYAGWLAPAFAAAGGAGLTWDIVVPRAAMDGKESAQRLASQTRLLASLTLLFAVLGSFLGGASFAPTLGVALGFAVFFLVCPHVSSISTFLGVVLGSTPLVFTPWILLGGGIDTIDSEALGYGFAGGCASAILLRLSWTKEGGVAPFRLARYLSFFAWALTAADTTAGPWYRLVWSAAVTGALVLLDMWIVKRRSFAPVVLTVASLHLSGAFHPTIRLYAPLAPQFAAVAAEFVLLIMAGYRYTLAGLLRLPIATYRSAPLCIVPNLKQAQDFPLKIDAI